MYYKFIIVLYKKYFHPQAFYKAKVILSSYIPFSYLFPKHYANSARESNGLARNDDFKYTYMFFL